MPTPPGFLAQLADGEPPITLSLVLGADGKPPQIALQLPLDQLVEAFDQLAEPAVVKDRLRGGSPVR